MTFEKTMDRLKEIISTLEAGNTTLDESLELYKEAISLSIDCKKEIQNAKLQVEIIDKDLNAK
ncbi:MAG: exodeoxyribonuclease VII small subunit [Clostridiales bacterium]|nr:exodeoxyribonuclease VII small subunit [Clostridiales bacterium]